MSPDGDIWLESIESFPLLPVPIDEYGVMERTENSNPPSCYNFLKTLWFPNRGDNGGILKKQLDGDVIRILAKSSLANPTTMSVLIWILLFVEAALLAVWMWSFFEIHSIIPHTFTWEALLSPYGSVTDYRNCSFSIDDCPKNLTRPIVPILGCCLTIVQMLMVICFVFFEGCLGSCFNSIKQVTTLQVIFFFFGLPTVVTFLVQNASGLENSMKIQLISVKNISVRWSITQKEQQCCGMESYLDWKLENGSLSYPLSCCDLTVSECMVNNISSLSVWQKGCYSVELVDTCFYGKVEIILICFEFAASVAIYFITKWFHRTFQAVKDDEEAPNKHIFMRQGNKYLSVNREGRNDALIQLEGFVLQTKGAVASTLGIIDSQITLQICNYSTSADKVQEYRESDRIFVGVLRDNLLRGSVVITAQNTADLDNVRVTSNSRGVINIQTQVLLYF